MLYCAASKPFLFLLFTSQLRVRSWRVIVVSLLQGCMKPNILFLPRSLLLYLCFVAVGLRDLLLRTISISKCNRTQFVSQICHLKWTQFVLRSFHVLFMIRMKSLTFNWVWYPDAMWECSPAPVCLIYCMYNSSNMIIIIMALWNSPVALQADKTLVV